MGTSSAYGGPSGANPLVPPWADAEGEEDGEGPNGEQEEDEQAPPTVVDTSWNIPKGRLTSIAKAGGEGDYGKVAGGFVKSLGGSSTATSTSTAGRKAASGLASFASSVSSVGPDEAVLQFDLQGYVGEDANTLLTAMAARLAPSGELHEDSVARTAMIRTLSELFEVWAVEEEGVGALNDLNEGDVESIISSYIGNYITERLLSYLFERVEENAESESVAAGIEDEITDFVKRSVDLTLEGVDVAVIDW